MVRILRPVLAVAMAIASLSPLGARAAGDALAIVTGLAPGDLLNVRADASAVGHTRTRLANGASVKNAGCGDFNGYQWCKVAVVDQPGLDGWVPARYLLAVDPEGTATPTLDAAEIKQGTHVAPASTTVEQGDTGGETSATTTAPPPKAETVAPPSNLAARFGDSPPSTAGGTAKPDAQASLTAAETEAYRAAYAKQAQQMAAGKTDAAKDATAASPVPETDPAAAGPADSAEAAPPPAQEDAGVAANVPVPTPRPTLESDGPEAQSAKPDEAGKTDVKVASAAPAADATPAPQIVALGDPQPPAQAWDATGEIPCARYVGQPMTRCRVGIKREGSGKADVTVTWPDGGTRVIGFYGGQPAGANSRGEFRFTREGDLNMIRVGVSERFEITDALAFGE